MKKISIIVNVIFFTILLALVFILFAPMCLPEPVINFMKNSTDVNKQHETNLVISLKSKDKAVMNDIYLSNKYISNNELQENYQELQLNLGDNDFMWKNLYKFNSLTGETPFDGRSIEFKDIGVYGISKPNSNELPFLYNFAINNINNMGISYRKYTLDPYSQDILDKLRINYEYTASGDIGTEIFVNFLTQLENSSAYESFFRENNVVEEVLLMDDSVSGIKEIVSFLKENSKVGEVKIKLSTGLKKIELVQMTISFDYIVDNKPIEMELYVSQDFSYSDIDITNINYFSSLVNIEQLSPDTEIEDKYGEYKEVDTTIKNPIDGEGDIPGVILSDEYNQIIGGN